MAVSAKHRLCKHEELSSVSRTHTKPDLWWHTLVLLARRGTDGWISGTHCSASLAYLVNSKPVTDPISKHMMETASEEQIQRF